MVEQQNTIDTISRRSFVTGSAVAAVSVAAAGVLTAPTKAFAVTAAQKKAEAQEALRKLNSMQEALDIASADYYTALDELQAAKKRMNEAQSKIDLTTNKIDEVQEDIATRVRSMYRTGSSSMLDMLLGSTTYQAFTSNWDLLNDMNEKDTKMVEESKLLKTEVEAEKVIYTQQEKIAAEKTKAAEEVKIEAEALVEEMQTTYQTLSAEAAQLLEQERVAAEEEARRRAAREASFAAAGLNDGKSQTVPGDTVVERAYKHLGLPYRWGATGPGSFDCSGFVSMCLSGKYGVRLGTTYTFMRMPRVGNPQPGDICTNSHHCGIYIGNGQMIHSPRAGDVVKISGVHPGMIFVRY